MVVKKAIGYCRRSSRRQKDNDSIEFQKQQIEIASNRLGYMIVEWCIDDAVSAFNKPASKRKGLIKLFDMVSSDDIFAVFFYDESRVDRSIISFVNEIFKPIKEIRPNTKFYSSSSNEEWDPFRFDIQFKLLNASYESISKSSRTKDNQISLMNNNKRPGSRTAFGLKKITSPNKEEIFIIDEEKASVVRFIYYYTGLGYSTEQIANILNDTNAPRPGKSKWHKSTIDAILKRPIYLGHNVWGIRSKSSSNNLLENNDVYPTIIENDLLELTHQAKDLEKRFGQFNTPYVFRSIAFCLKCNVMLKTRDDTPSKNTTKHKYQSYICPICKGKVGLNQIHSVIYKSFTNQWSLALGQMEKIGMQKLYEMKKVIEQELDLLKEKEELLKYNESMIPSLDLRFPIEKHIKQVKEDLVERRKNLNDTLDQIESLLTQDGAINFTLFLSLSSDLEKLTNIEKRMIALSFIEKINVDMDLKKINIDFRLHPFISLDFRIRQLTETKENKMDA